MDLYRQDELDNMMYEQAREEERKRIEEYERIHDEQRKEIIDSMHETAKRTVFSEDDDDPERSRKLLTSLMMLGMFAKNLTETGDIYGRDPLKPDD
jgi:hypothetical protein